MRPVVIETLEEYWAGQVGCLVVVVLLLFAVPYALSEAAKDLYEQQRLKRVPGLHHFNIGDAQVIANGKNSQFIEFVSARAVVILGAEIVAAGSTYVLDQVVLVVEPHALCAASVNNHAVGFRYEYGGQTVRAALIELPSNY